ncbi:hypothetical protein JXA40_09575 [bacterium]|nr:hypothetical protein [candidate division CSSED10-310 bacterium]
MKKSDGRKRLPEQPVWQSVTWSGAEREMIRISASMTFRQRLEWLEEAAFLMSKLHNAPRQSLGTK